MLFEQCKIPAVSSLSRRFLWWSKWKNSQYKSLLQYWESFGVQILKNYHAVAAVCRGKIIVLGTNTYDVLEVCKNVQSTSDESCIDPNTTVIFKIIHKSDNKSLNMKVKYISNQLEKSNVDESTISDIKNKFEIYIEDLLD